MYRNDNDNEHKLDLDEDKNEVKEIDNKIIKISKSFEDDQEEMTYKAYGMVSSAYKEYFEHIVNEDANDYYISSHSKNLQKLIETRLSTNSAKYSFTEVLNALNQLINSLYVLHELCTHKIIHRNINTQNIYITDNLQFLLGGFDYVYIIEDEEEEEEEEENIVPKQFIKDVHKGYFAPELFNKTIKKYDPFKSDIYSLGICMIQMLQTANIPPLDPMNVIQEYSEKYKHKEFEQQVLAILKGMVDDMDKRFDIQTLKVLLECY